MRWHTDGAYFYMIMVLTNEKLHKSLETVLLLPNLLFELAGMRLLFGRSHKEKRSAYAPEKGLRYDGVYRIEKCWRKDGKQVTKSAHG